MMGDTSQLMTRIYRRVWWMQLLCIFSGLLNIILSILLMLIVWTSIIATQLQLDVDIRANAFIVVLRIPLTGSALLMAARGFIAAGQGILSYLKTSQEGLEYREWPIYSVRCRWEEVDRVVKLRPLFGTELRLTGGEKSGPKWAWQVLSWIRRFFRMGSELAIPLSSFKGWKDGELAEDLRENAPHAFEARVVS